MIREDILFAYQGYFTFKITEKLLCLLEPHLYSITSKIIRKKLFYISVEMIQNVYQYNKTIGTQEILKNPSNFVIRKIANSLEIVTANYIRPADKHRLKNLLDKINSMNQEALTQEHYQRLSAISDDTPSANIGILSIARRINRNLDYQFIDVNGSQYFVLKAYIP